MPSGILEKVVGVRGDGSRMEPIARDGQIDLVREHNPSAIRHGTLACVDLEDLGTVIKRCYPAGGEWILSPANPVEMIAPMRVLHRNVVHVDPVVGVLFHTN